MSKNSKKKIKTCFIGLGKRARTFYIPILQKLNEEFELTGFTKKTNLRAKEIEQQYNIRFFNSIRSMVENNPSELIIVCVPSTEVPKVVNELQNVNATIFIDTPVYWDVNQTSKLNILASEQWPFLPIEQFKKLLIDSGELGDVFYSENDSRTFEYHGIAQLRNYFHSKKQISKITGSMLFRPEEQWNFGVVRYSDNTGFLYKFSYFTKKSSFRTHQALKIYCTKGSIISGCLHEKGNDYEIFKISKAVNDNAEHCNAIVKRSEKTITNKDTSYHSGTNYYEIESISCEFSNDKKIIWQNPFLGKGFNDQEIAIATLLTNARNVSQGTSEALYPAYKSYQDYVIMNHIRQSSQ